MLPQPGYEGEEGFDPNMVIKQEENGDDEGYGQYNIPPEEDDTFKEEFAAAQGTGVYPDPSQSDHNPYGDFGGYAKNGDSEYEDNVQTYGQ